MILELYDALKAAGAPEDKAQAAATALAEHQRRFNHIDGELVAIRADIKVVENHVKALESQLAGVFTLILRSFMVGA